MKTLIALASLVLLAACGAENEDQAAAAEAVAQAPLPEPISSAPPAPDRDKVSELVAAACPAMESVNEAVCRSKGMGSNAFGCEFSLGEDEYLRNDAEITLSDENEWQLADTDTVCAQGA